MAMEIKQTKSIECALCLENFKDPRILPCFHTFCRDCLQTHITSSKYSCPICRANHTAPPKGVDGIQKNFYMFEMMEMNSTSKYPICKEHNPEDMRFYCMQCERPICRDCKVIKHEGHTIDMVSNVAQQKKLLAQQILDKVQEGKQQFIAQLGKCRNKVEHEKQKADYILACIERGTMDMKDEIDSMYNDVRKAVTLIKSEINTDEKSCMNKLCDSGNELETHSKLLTTAIEEQEDSEAVSQCNHIIKLKKNICKTMDLPQTPRIPSVPKTFLDDFNTLSDSIHNGIAKYRREHFRALTEPKKIRQDFLKTSSRVSAVGDQEHQDKVATYMPSTSNKKDNSVVQKDDVKRASNLIDQGMIDQPPRKKFCF